MENNTGYEKQGNGQIFVNCVNGFGVLDFVGTSIQNVMLGCEDITS